MDQSGVLNVLKVLLACRSLPPSYENVSITVSQGSLGKRSLGKELYEVISDIRDSRVSVLSRLQSIS